MKTKLLLIALTTLLAAGSASAQFRNNGIQIPTVGALGLGCLTPSAFLVGDATPICLGNDDYQRHYPTNNPDAFNGWGLTHQPTIGVGYFRALGYDLWWDSQISIGIGASAFPGGNMAVTPSILVSSGVRYNFLDEEIRPFVSSHIEILTIPVGSQRNLSTVTSAVGDVAVFAGLRAGGGIEWFFLPAMRELDLVDDLFYDEMSLQLEGNMAIFADLNSFFPLIAQVGRLSFNVYF